MAFATGALLVSLFALSGPAGATGYPPSTGNNTTCSFSVAVTLNTTITVTVTCVFAPGSTITITLNGAPYQTATAPASGIFIEVFTATDPHISMNGGPAVSTSYGAVNTVVATGTNPTGGTNVGTTLVTIPAPAAQAATPVAAGAIGPARARLELRSPREVVGGLVLIALGFLAVILARRRRTPAAPE